MLTSGGDGLRLFAALRWPRSLRLACFERRADKARRSGRPKCDNLSFFSATLIILCAVASVVTPELARPTSMLLQDVHAPWRKLRILTDLKGRSLADRVNRRRMNSSSSGSASIAGNSSSRNGGDHPFLALAHETARGEPRKTGRTVAAHIRLEPDPLSGVCSLQAWDTRTRDQERIMPRRAATSRPGPCGR